MKNKKKKEIDSLMEAPIENLKTLIVNRFLNWLIGCAVAVGFVSLLVVVFFHD